MQCAEIGLSRASTLFPFNKTSSRNAPVHESGAAFTSSASNTLLYNSKTTVQGLFGHSKVEVDAKLGIRPTAQFNRSSSGTI